MESLLASSCSKTLVSARTNLDNGVGNFKTSTISKGLSSSFVGKKVECRAIDNGKKQTLAPVKVRAEMPPESAMVVEPSSPENRKSSSDETIQQFLKRDYKWGFTTDIESDTLPKGLSEETIRFISKKKDEPDWLLEFRLKAFRQWLKMKEPNWSDNKYSPIDYQVCKTI